MAKSPLLPEKVVHVWWRCPLCKREYRLRKDAMKCLASWKGPVFRVGDIVQAPEKLRGYGGCSPTRPADARKVRSIQWLPEWYFDEDPPGHVLYVMPVQYPFPLCFDKPVFADQYLPGMPGVNTHNGAIPADMLELAPKDGGP